MPRTIATTTQRDRFFIFASINELPIRTCQRQIFGHPTDVPSPLLSYLFFHQRAQIFPWTGWARHTRALQAGGRYRRVASEVARQKIPLCLLLEGDRP